MACSHPFATIHLDLTEYTWIIQANDDSAASVVSALAKAMSLSPVRPEKECANQQRCIMQVVVADEPTSSKAVDGVPATLTCQILPPENKDILLYDMMVVAQALIQAERARGGILIHGGLAESPNCHGGGILLAGPGNVGKTTASNRLPPPWRSLSDDASLVIRDSKGKYWAHPWPTWSRFFTTPDDNSSPGGAWAVEQRVPLSAIFFLNQAEEEQVTPISHTPALTYLMETVQQISRPSAKYKHSAQIRMIEERQLAAAEELVQVIPSYTLHLSLTGKFWEKIEETLASKSFNSAFLAHQVPNKLISPEKQGGNTAKSHTDDSILHVSYSGPSMYPTLLHHDLLEILPYSNNSARAGDVICFATPGGNMKVIHRVVKLTADGIQTRGDNNSANDPYILEQKNIIGKVTAAWRNGKRHKIYGGIRGNFSGFNSTLKRRTRACVSFFLHGTYRRLATSGLFRHLLPVSLRPTVFEFKQQHLPSILKLIVNRDVIGRYDFLKKVWVIDLPWKLVIDTNKLPVAIKCHSADMPIPAEDEMKPYQHT